MDDRRKRLPHLHYPMSSTKRTSLFFLRFFNFFSHRLTAGNRPKQLAPFGGQGIHRSGLEQAVSQVPSHSSSVDMRADVKEPAVNRPTQSARLDTVPPELLDEIIRDLLPLDLKALRQTCHRLATLTAPRLFQSIVVVPFEDSFKNLKCLAGHAQLSGHVQHVTYVAKTAGGIIYSFEDFKVDVLRLPDAKGIRRVPYTDSLQLDWGHKIEEYPSKKLYGLYHAYNALCMKSVSDNAKHVEVVSLAPALRKLDNLKKFTVTGGHWIDQPRCILRALEQAGLYSSRFIRALDVNGRLESLLAAAKFAGRPIHELTILDLSEHKGTISQDFWTAMSSVVSDMQSLYLQAGSYNDEGLKSHLQLPFLLQQCSVVRFLELDLQRGMYSAPALVFKILFTRKPENLSVQDLRLRNFSVTETDLVKGLSGMSQSLRSLVIENVTLRHQPEFYKNKTTKGLGKADSGCWTKVLRGLSQDLNLSHFSLEGYLRNAVGGQFISTYRRRPFELVTDRKRGQYLEVDHKMVDVVKKQNNIVLPRYYLVHEADCLRKRVERFVTDGGPCPLETREDSEKIPSSWLGDYSFRFDPSMH